MKKFKYIAFIIAMLVAALVLFACYYSGETNIIITGQTQTTAHAQTTYLNEPYTTVPQPPNNTHGGSDGNSNSQNNRPPNPAISLQNAIEIAEADLARRGISATFRSNSGLEWERGQWVWELEFRSGRYVIEYYINVDTGAIVKFEMERD